MKTSTRVVVLGALVTSAVEGFAPTPHTTASTSSSSSSALHFFGGGTGAKDLDEEWERQQELLKLRRASPEEREKCFKSVDDRRIKATEEQIDKWAWQKKQYAKGEDPSSSSGDSGSGTTKKTVETTSSSTTSNHNNDYVVVDTSNGGAATMEEECNDELFLRLRSEALQVVE